jgi:hypothetical protein
MSARAFTILDAVRDSRLFGKAFRDEATWRAWQAFLAALFGIAMSGEQAETFRACTGAALGFLTGLFARRGWSAVGGLASRSSWR